MAELDIKQRQMGDVTILDLDGNINMGEASVALRKSIRGLVEEGKKKVVLNLARVRYIDSSGIGELVSSYMVLERNNGMLRLSNLTDKIHNLLNNHLKLLTVYDAYDSVEAAVDSFASKESYILCPVHGCDNVISCSGLHSRLNWTCRKCGTDIHLKPLPSGGSNEVSIKSLRFPTYEMEGIEIEPGAPTTITVNGRLDLFASEVLEKAWLTVPVPRHVIFRVGTSDGLSPLGIKKLLALCSSKREGDAAVIWQGGEIFPAGPPVYDQRDSALAALGDISPGEKWLIDIRG